MLYGERVNVSIVEHRWDNEIISEYELIASPQFQMKQIINKQAIYIPSTQKFSGFGKKNSLTQSKTHFYLFDHSFHVNGKKIIIVFDEGMWIPNKQISHVVQGTTKV